MKSCAQRFAFLSVHSGIQTCCRSVTIISIFVHVNAFFDGFLLEVLDISILVGTYSSIFYHLVACLLEPF